MKQEYRIEFKDRADRIRWLPIFGWRFSSRQDTAFVVALKRKSYPLVRVVRAFVTT